MDNYGLGINVNNFSFFNLFFGTVLWIGLIAIPILKMRKTGLENFSDIITWRARDSRMLNDYFSNSTGHHHCPFCPLVCLFIWTKPWNRKRISFKKYLNFQTSLEYTCYIAGHQLVVDGRVGEKERTEEEKQEKSRDQITQVKSISDNDRF